MEIWKPLRNFPSYNGSSEGRIMNVRTQNVLTPTQMPDGTLRVCLQKNNKQYHRKVHRVIAETFLGEHPGMDVRHRDLNPLNNCVDNLYWTSRSDTIRDAYERGTKTPYQSIAIRIIETGEVYDSIKSCAKAIGCDTSYIRQYFAGTREHVKHMHFEKV